MNILGSCTFYDVNLLKIPADIREKLDKEFDFDADSSEVRLSEETIDKYNIPSETVDYDSCDFDEDELEYTLEDLIGNHPNYLVFASGCRWNGASGYTFCDNITDTVKRNYEISLRLVEQFKNGIECIESSHDVPTGSHTYIIGITDEERDSLEDADFSEIEEFVNRKRKS